MLIQCILIHCINTGICSGVLVPFYAGICMNAGLCGITRIQVGLTVKEIRDDVVYIASFGGSIVNSLICIYLDCLSPSRLRIEIHQMYTYIEPLLESRFL